MLIKNNDGVALSHNMRCEFTRAPAAAPGRGERVHLMAARCCCPRENTSASSAGQWALLPGDPVLTEATEVTMQGGQRREQTAGID